MAAHGPDAGSDKDFKSTETGNYPGLVLYIKEHTEIRPGERTAAHTAAQTSLAAFETWLSNVGDAWGTARWSWWQGLSTWQKNTLYVCVKFDAPVVTP